MEEISVPSSKWYDGYGNNHIPRAARRNRYNAKAKKSRIGNNAAAMGGKAYSAPK